MSRLSCFFFVGLTSLSVPAWAQLAYPGSNWSAMTYNPSVVRGPEDNNLLLQGNLEQGIVWGMVGQWKVNTYAAIAYSADRNGLAYNNKLTPAIGVKLQRPLENGVFDIGIQAVGQRNFRGVTSGPRSGSGIQIYAQYWVGWDLKK